MSDTSPDTSPDASPEPATPPEVIQPDAVEAGSDEATDAAPAKGDAITEPGKVMRIGSMIKQLLEEVRQADLDEASRERLAEVYERSVVELSEAMSPELQEELRSLALPFEHDDVPSEAELRVAKAQLVGWLEGLFHGIQASLMAQQLAAQQQLQQMRQLPGQQGPQGQPGQRQPGPQAPPQTGTYL